MHAAEALRHASDVHVEEACGQPGRLSELLAAEIDRRRSRAAAPPLRIVAGVVVAEPPWARAAAAGGAEIRALMAGRGLRNAGAAVAPVPIGYAEIAPAFGSGRLAVDTVLISTTAEGTLGIQHGYLTEVIDAVAARGGTVLVERNGALPHVAGAPRIDLDVATDVVDVERDTAVAVVRAPDEAEAAAAANAASLIPDRACVQIGIGTLGDAFCDALGRAGVRGLSLHSGMLGDGAAGLAHAADLADSTPLGDPPLSAASLIGSRDLFAWAAGEPRVRLHASTRIHPVAVTSRIERFCAVNFALEVDLAGNAGAEAVHGRLVSGPGGQLDFATGACAAPEGRSIVVLPATGPGGSSRIVPSLSGPTTTPASRVHYVATDQGVAELAGRTAQERAEALVAVAAPQHRRHLRSAIERS